MLHRLCSVEDLAAGTAAQYEAGGVELALWRDTDGSFHAIDAMCTHGDVPLVEADLADGKVECWAHCATFDLRTGEATLPATRPVNVYPVTVTDGDVFVEIEANV